MPDPLFKLLATISVDRTQFERDLNLAETKAEEKALAIQGALGDLKIKFSDSTLGSGSNLVEEARRLSLSVSQALKLPASAGIYTKEAQEAARALETLAAGQAR